MTYDPKPPPPADTPAPEPEDSGDDPCMKCGKRVKFFFYLQLCDACLEAANDKDDDE